MSRLILALLALSTVATVRADGAPKADPAPTAAAPTPLSGIEVIAHMRALAISRRDALESSFPELAPANGDGIAALGPCKRPDEARRKAIAATIEAWLARQPETRSDAVLSGINHGCDEAAGTVVDVQADVLTKDHHEGHWWILRVKDRTVDVLAHQQGTALNDFMEWANETTLQTVGLADLDRDGTLDVIAALVSHEGGAITRYTELSSILSRTRRTIKVAELEGSAAVPRGQRYRPGDPVVLSIREHTHDRRYERVFYRCVDGRRGMSRCNATRLAKQLDAAWALARSWIDTRTPSVPDRDLLVEQLVALDAAADERARLLASVPATDPGLQLVRRIEQVVYPDDDRTDVERYAEERAEAEAWSARLRSAFGARRCGLSDAARTEEVSERLRAWGEGHTPTGNTACSASSGCWPATRFEIKGGCTGARGSYYELAWGPSNGTYGVHRHTVLFVTDDRITAVRDFAAVGDDSPPAASGEFVDPGFRLAFSRQGNTAVAVVLDQGGTVVVDGAVAGTLPDELAFYVVGSGVLSDVVVTSSGNNGTEHWRAGRSGFERLGAMPWGLASPAADQALPQILVDRELADHARLRLTGVDWSAPGAVSQLRDPGPRAELVQALTILKADRSLIAAVKAL